MRFPFAAMKLSRINLALAMVVAALLLVDVGFLNPRPACAGSNCVGGTHIASPLVSNFSYSLNQTTNSMGQPIAKGLESGLYTFVSPDGDELVAQMFVDGVKVKCTDYTNILPGNPQQINVDFEWVLTSGSHTVEFRGYEAVTTGGTTYWDVTKTMVVP